MVVLDDDPAVLDTIRMMARRLGLETMTCGTLAELESVLASFEPDVLLIDLMMPGLDGIDVVRRIGPRPGTSMFVMSGTDRRTYDASRKVLASYGAKISGFLSKPFGPMDLARVFSSSLTRPDPRRARIVPQAARDILSPGEFEEKILSGRIEPFYQPIFRADGRTLKGFEALARVEGGRTDCFAPEYLDQLVANKELSELLTDQVIQRSLRFMSRLASHDDLTISINLFGTHAIAEGFREWLVEQCMRNGIARERVILELSEATVFGLDDEGLRKITQLRLAGFGLSIDDFGTGHSSLGRLASLPFSELKIDKAFCRDLPQSQSAAAIIEACLGLAARLDMKVTAEGVETEEVAARLATMGCDALQGHFFGQAMSGEVVLQWLSESQPLAAA